MFCKIYGVERKGESARMRYDGLRVRERKSERAYEQKMRRPVSSDWKRIRRKRLKCDFLPAPLTEARSVLNYGRSTGRMPVPEHAKRINANRLFIIYEKKPEHILISVATHKKEDKKEKLYKFKMASNAENCIGRWPAVVKSIKSLIDFPAAHFCAILVQPFHLRQHLANVETYNSIYIRKHAGLVIW